MEVEEIKKEIGRMKLKNGLGHSQASSIMPLKSCFCSTFALPMVRRSVNTR